MSGQLDFGLGETADMIRETVRRFSSEQIAPIAAEIDTSNKFPAISGPRWARWVCTASRWTRRQAGWAWGISSMPWRWKKFRAVPPRWG